MTPTDPEDRDELKELLRLITSDRAQPGDPEVPRAIEEIYGRPDALDLLREVAREEQLVRLLKVRTGIGGESDRESQPARGRTFAITSIEARSPRSTGVGRWKTIVLAAAAALMIGIVLNWDIASNFLQSLTGAPPITHTVATQAAELDTVDMPDGSRAIVAPNSSLRYTMAAKAGERDVWLEGEAYFEVEHDERRPFRVRTRSTTVEDLGTSFVVREYAGDAGARVAVRDGAAAILQGDASGAPVANLAGGEGAYIDSTGRISRFSGNPESFGAWTSGRLVFDAAPLSEVLSTLSRWYGVELRMSDSTLAEQYFTGAVSAQSLDKALDLLGPVVHARFERRGQAVVVVPRPGGS